MTCTDALHIEILTRRRHLDFPRNSLFYDSQNVWKGYRLRNH